MKKILNLLRKLAEKIFENDKCIIQYPYSEMLSIINSFPEPKSDAERCLFQFKCTVKRNRKIIFYFATLISQILFPYYLKKGLKSANEIHIKEKHDAVLLTNRNNFDIIPQELKNKYKKIKLVKYTDDWMLSKNAYNFLEKNIFPICKNKYFRLKILMKFCMISSCIELYSPKAIISFTESSFATSAITNFCELLQIKNIYVMHGERSLDLKYPFFRCHEYYSWDQAYIEQFKLMRCCSNLFTVAVPDELLLDKFDGNIQKQYDYTFYLQDEDKKSIKIYKKIFTNLIDKGYVICIRPHPFFKEIVTRSLADMDLVIEDTETTPLYLSLSLTKNAVSKFSTVLYQAWYKGVPIVIDNLSMPNRYKRLVEIRYIMLQKKHILLSELIGDD